ncbi:hypothetical protein KKF59_04395 [Patescibacteria group bacterium]|nr:hypothetical protein [Patescibacteria group bacterium]MBU1034598.1 hypothetical protein [Patescibacteria group bacterium]MBU1629639.1 hypothetical protein [Patescibacteria group bacterium]MBU1908334.1 hypothetical protein [Patescibacteria group bacterium]
MAIRIYLHENIVFGNLLAYARKCAHEGKQGSALFEGMKLAVDSDGRLYYQMKEDIIHPSIAIPCPLLGHVRVISWWTRIPSSPHRTLGEYEADGAEAQLDLDPQDPIWPRLVIYGQNIESMLGLYSSIRSGKAIPFESWENELAPANQPAAHAQLPPHAGQ